MVTREKSCKFTKIYEQFIVTGHNASRKRILSLDPQDDHKTEQLCLWKQTDEVA